MKAYEFESPQEMLARFEVEGYQLAESSVFGRPLFVTADPEIAYQLLVKKRRTFVKSQLVSKFLALGAGPSLISMEGKTWAKRRKLLQPSFSNRRLKQYMEIMICEEERLEAELAVGLERVDIDAVSSHFVSRVLPRMLLPESEARGVVAELARVITENRERNMAFASKLNGYGARLREVLSSTEEMGNEKTILDPMLEQHCESGSKRLSWPVRKLRESFMPPPPREVQTKDLVDEIRGMVIAGHETTASVASHFWWYVGRSPALQERLREEASAADVELATHRSHPWITATFSEVMRLHPPGPILVRESINDTKLANRVIPAKSLIAVSIYSLHRNPLIWEKPQEFQPERFFGEIDAKNYIPFGIGPRQCIGNRAAYLELCVHAVRFLRKYEVTVESPERLCHLSAANLRLDHPVVVRLRQI